MHPRGDDLGSQPVAVADALREVAQPTLLAVLPWRSNSAASSVSSIRTTTDLVEDTLDEAPPDRPTSPRDQDAPVGQRTHVEPERWEA